MLEADNTQQLNQEEKAVPTLEDIRQQRNKEQEAKQHQHFIENMEGKTSSQLSISELNYLYREHRSTYDRINQDKSKTVSNIAWLDKMASQKKASEARLEEQKTQLKKEFGAEASLEGTEKPTFKLTDKAMEDMINKSIEKAMKNFKLF